MSYSNRFPILVTYRSAEAFRDAGIRYAYLKSGMAATFTVAVVLLSAVLWLVLKYPGQIHPLAWLLLSIAVVASTGVVLCARAVEFPHCPRMTLEELEIMRTEMGIPIQVFQQTYDSVLQGSMEEVHAGWKTQELIQRFKNSGRFD